MKISGGIAKGRKIATKKAFSKALKDKELRPTSSKVREALFDIIRDHIKGSRFVDLYAGTGAVGLEALSRGAGTTVFVEPNKLRAQIIKDTAVKFDFREKATVVMKRAEAFLKKASTEKERFDIFFLDPPYSSEEIMRTLPMIGEKKMLNNGGMVIVEHFFKRKLPEKVGELKMARSYIYGDAMLTIYEKEER